MTSDFSPWLLWSEAVHLPPNLTPGQLQGRAEWKGTGGRVLTAVLNVASHSPWAQVCLALHSLALVRMWSVFVGRCMRNWLSWRNAPENLHRACEF